MQAEAPATDEKVPCAHKLQAVAAALPVKEFQVPTLQSVQDIEPLTAKEPALQVLHAMIEVAPITEDQVPPGQVLHTDLVKSS
jgi:hypothetical protein